MHPCHACQAEPCRCVREGGLDGGLELLGDIASDTALAAVTHLREGASMLLDGALQALGELGA